ncbi:MAG: hypothetical protein GC200_05930 [Tepidisphaera sp.]|nr:hypothetical protein [Tepidisphaera sp.]
MSVMERTTPSVRQPAAPLARVVWRVGVPSHPSLRLTITVHADGRAVAETTDAHGTRELCEFFASLRFDGAAGLAHLDGEHLAATVRLGGTDAGEVLYARTDLLRELGIPGGRYEVARA